MSRTNIKREKLVSAATRLIHEKGYYQTSLADIAKDSGVPLGNVYYYFKTKDDIAAAVIDLRIKEYEGWFQQWEHTQDAKERLLDYLDNIKQLRQQLTVSGCPVGSLCQELVKKRAPLADKAGNALQLLLDWITDQFRLLGKENARELAIQMLSAVQGAIVLANSLRDPNVVHQQAQYLENWVKTI